MKKGRYELNSAGTFTTSCAVEGCSATIELDPMYSGCVVLPRMLRQHGWTMLGKRNGAKWHCPNHRVTE